MRQVTGKHALTEAINQGSLTEVIIPKKMLKRYKELIEKARKKGVPIQTIEDILFTQQYGKDRTIIGLCRNTSQQHLLTTDELTPDSHPLVIILDHIQDPHNMGAIIRTAAGLGINALIFPKDRSCQLTDTVTKVSSGGTECLPLLKVTNLAREIDRLKEKGYWIYGADSNKGMPLSQVRFHHPAVLVVGNEGKGLSSLLIKKLDQAVYIPMSGPISSLNVSVATGIILHKMIEV